MKAFVALLPSGLLHQSHLFQVSQKLSFATRPNRVSDHHFHSPDRCWINRWTLSPTVPDATTLLNPSSKHSCHNISNTLQIVNVINKRCHQLALIATRRYVAPNLPNHYFSLVTQIIVSAKACLCKMHHVNCTNQTSLTTAI